MAFTEEDKQRMEVAAGEAEQVANDNVPDEALNQVANWWKRWYMNAGHKRLARILLQSASEEDKG